MGTREEEGGVKMQYSRFRSETTEVFKKYKKDYKHGIKYMGCETFEDLIMLIGKNVKEEYEKGNIQVHETIQYDYIKSIYGKGCENYYIESKALYEFLKNVEIVDTSAIENAVEEYGKQYVKEEYRETTSVKKYCFFIHSPGVECSTFVVTSINEFKTLNWKNSGIGVANGDDCAAVEFCQINKKWVSKDIDTDRMKLEINLAVNLFLYLSCFPECVTNKAPKGVIVSNNQIGRSHIISTHESLFDRSSVTPHFRNGHFRLLQSDRFTKKRGQVVFVRSTFVKGQAKTVLDNGERDLAAYAAGE